MKEAIIVAVMKGIYAIAYTEACKQLGLQRDLNLWPRDNLFCLSPIYWQTVHALMSSKTLVFHSFKIIILIKVGSHHAK